MTTQNGHHQQQGQRVGYARVSTTDQRLDRQLETLRQAGCDPVLEEKASAAARAPRPELLRLVGTAGQPGYLRRGDTLVVSSWDRLARSVSDMESLVTDLNQRGVAVESVTQHQVFRPGDADPMLTAMRQMMSVFAELERSLIRERQREGIVRAKERGAYQGGMAKLDAGQVAEIRRLDGEGVPKARIAQRFGVTRVTVRKALDESYVPRPGAAEAVGA